MSTMGGQMLAMLATTALGSILTFALGFVSEQTLFWAISLLIPILAAIYMAWSAYRFGESAKASEEYNTRLLSIIDKMNGKQLVVDRMTDRILVHKDSVSRTRTFDITNKMDETAETFRIGEYTSAVPNKLSEIDVYRDGVKVVGITGESVRYETFRRIGMYGSETKVPFEYDLLLPIDLNPGQSCSLELRTEEDRTLIHFINEKGGAIGQKIHHETNVMELVIELDEELSEKYDLRIMDNLGTSAFTVTDGSRNRLRSIESSMPAAYRPKLEGNRLTWILPDPARDCTYCVSFGMFLKQGVTEAAVGALKNDTSD